MKWRSWFRAETGEELQGLGLQPGFMEIEEAFDLVCPPDAILYRAEEGLGAEEGVNDDLAGFAGLGWLQGRVELAKDACRVGEFAEAFMKGAA